jgi:hypothetical protein
VVEVLNLLQSFEVPVYVVAGALVLVRIVWRAGIKVYSAVGA